MLKNKKALIIIGILLLPTIAHASDVFGERITMWLIHNYYEEECLNHERIKVEKVEYFCNTTWRHLTICNHCYSKETGETISEDECDDVGGIDCNCPRDSIVPHNKTVSVFTDVCVKYHLVRKV